MCKVIWTESHLLSELHYTKMLVKYNVAVREDCILTKKKRWGVGEDSKNGDLLQKKQ